ncbi:MAG: GNAT family N-acetyltransferase [Anaerolineae bacterium]
MSDIEELTFRPGRPDDLPEVTRLCSGTWDWGDYIPDVWEYWLADDGHVAVAELDGRLVALGRVVVQPRGQAWLEGMRVDPEYRRRGIAWRFTEYKLAYARAHGARVARLSTADSNEPVHRMMERLGMARVGRYEMLTADAQPGDGALHTLSPDDAGAVAAFLQQSPVLAAARGLYSLDWAWQELSPERTVELLAAGHVVGRWGADGNLAALAVLEREPEDGRLWVGFADAGPASWTQAGPAPATQAGPVLDAQAKAFQALAHDLRDLAARWQVERVSAMLPALPALRDAFRAAGYGQVDWHGELWIYELPLEEAAGRDG